MAQPWTLSQWLEALADKLHAAFTELRVRTNGWGVVGPFLCYCVAEKTNEKPRLDGVKHWNTVKNIENRERKLALMGVWHGLTWGFSMVFASNSGVFVDIFRQKVVKQIDRSMHLLYTQSIWMHIWKSSKVLGKGTSQMRNGGRTQYEMCMDERGNKSDDSIASNQRH